MTGSVKYWLGALGVACYRSRPCTGRGRTASKGTVRLNHRIPLYLCVLLNRVVHRGYQSTGSFDHDTTAWPSLDDGLA